MKAMINSLDAYHDTKKGKLVFGGVELVLALILGVLAVDSGSLWQYGLTILFFVGGLRNLINALRVSSKSNVKKSKR